MNEVAVQGHDANFFPQIKAGEIVEKYENIGKSVTFVVVQTYSLA